MSLPNPSYPPRSNHFLKSINKESTKTKKKKKPIKRKSPQAKMKVNLSCKVQIKVPTLTTKCPALESKTLPSNNHNVPKIRKARTNQEEKVTQMMIKRKNLKYSQKKKKMNQSS